MPPTRGYSPIESQWVPPEDRGSVVYVWCSADIPRHAVDQFLLAADHRYFFKRKYRLCLVHNYDLHGYQPRHPSLRKPNNPLFVNEKDLPCVPAACATVSIELDELSAEDVSTCLLRVNGWGKPEKYGEVRCRWKNALLVSVVLQDGKTDMMTLQCIAAFNGGVVPAEGGGRSWIMNSRIPDAFTQRRMPPASKGRPDDSSPCPVFVTGRVRRKVLNRFLEEVNMRGRIHRASIINIDMKRDESYHFVKKPPLLGKLPKAFRGITLGALCEFMTGHCRQADINSKYFVVLDGFTCERLPAMRGQAFERRSGKRLNCAIVDTFCEGAGGPLALRCTFNSAAEILDDLMTTGASLQQYANDAAVERRGCHCFSTNYDGTVLFPQPMVGLSVMKESEEVCSRDVTSDLAGLQRVIEEHQFTGDPADCPPELSQPDVGEHLPSPIKSVVRSRLAQWIEQRESDTVLPEVEVIPRRKRRCSPDPDHDSGIGSSQHTANPSSRVDSESPSKRRKVDSIMDDEVSEDDDDDDGDEEEYDDIEDDAFYEIKLPRCTGLTQLSFD
ncbi:uncharacterized protein J3D65DRAFT_635478 [Phyllosticta citribraziliensis]|uniref:Uncharacterized protein n=1 Tax=Phyllosticta citribraziliensis TaxID=989973 RepID=A0ABR1LEE8_9PEZI